MDRVRAGERGGLAMNSAGTGEARPFVFDLQFFAQERTEPATPRKREKVRGEGKVCKSKDLTAAIEIVIGLIGLLYM